MHWIVLLSLAAAFVAILALFRAQPEGTRPAGSTRMMSAARVVLVVAALLVLVAWLTGG